ncbi:P-loop containing nucleoside triphosphate hydrolase protein [Powellomyces hirtus]|nr:P-loop containing nucleoside triphosphate hydrolase protein [Powellomyces hirtus]
MQQQQQPAYVKMRMQRESLPAWKYQSQILEAVDGNRVVVVEGETGCGKTTQVPQFILDHFLSTRHGAECKILVTQPRRISAIGVAERVAAERAEPLGKTVGYQIRLESRMSEETRILFATTGILLRRLEGAGAKALVGNEPAAAVADEYEGGIDDLTHIIVDEVHERSVDSDFLLMVLRDLLATNPTLKLILMSATLNAGLFQDYFADHDTPRIHVPGRTFPVQVMFLEHALAKTRYVPQGKDFTKSTFSRQHSNPRDMDPNSESMDEEELPDDKLTEEQMKKRYPKLSDKAIGALRQMDVDKIQYPLIEMLPPPDRGILIFLPGFLEISTLHDALTRNPRIRAATQNGKWCIPLHGNLSSADQLRVFKRPDPGAVKIVVATNVAETSITVDDVVFVIDSGKMKETRYDPQKGMASLEECWVSRANAMQRRGRAGRVTKGVCVHLFTSHHFENLLAPQQVPEMRRTPLEQLCLRIKVLPFLNGRIAQILDKVIEPPSPEAVRQAVLTLRTLQALTKEEDLTPLGFHLGRLPLDVRIGKLLVFGSIFQCLDPVLTIAAAMSHKSPFVAPFEIRDQADRKKREFAIENSDQLTILNAYNAWQHTRTHNPASVEKKFLFDNFLSGKSLAMIANVKRQLAELISDIGFLETPVTARAIERLGRATGSDGVKESIGERANHRGDDLRLVKALLLAALYPNVIKVTQGVKPDGGDTQLLVRGNEEVFIHPTSINFRKPHPPGTFLAYHEKVKTSKVYIRDASAVPAAAVAFFGGSLGPYEPRGGGLLPMDDGWLRFRAHNPKIAAVVRAARVALDELLQEKIRDPSAMFEGELVTCIVDVVTRHAA